jgi:hypothetical protein
MFLKCDGHVSPTELQSGDTESSNVVWPSPAFPVRFGRKYGENQMIEDRKIVVRLYFRMHVKCYRTTLIGMLCIGT